MATVKSNPIKKKSSKISKKVTPAQNLNAYGIGMFAVLSLTFLIIIIAKYW